MSTTQNKAIVGVNFEGTETLAADNIDASTYDVWTRGDNGCGHTILTEWVANYPTIAAAQAAHPDAEVLNG